MGLFDMPAPLFDWIDGGLHILAPALRLLLWGMAAGVTSMWLYRVLSPQQRIARGKREQRRARERLDGFDGELAAAWPLIRDLLGTALAQVGRATLPAVAASLPILFLLVWLSAAYGQGPGDYLPVGPDWMRGWQFTFFAALIATSLVVKRALRIE